MLQTITDPSFRPAYTYLSFWEKQAVRTSQRLGAACGGHVGGLRAGQRAAGLPLAPPTGPGLDDPSHTGELLPFLLSWGPGPVSSRWFQGEEERTRDSEASLARRTLGASPAVTAVVTQGSVCILGQQRGKAGVLQEPWEQCWDVPWRARWDSVRHTRGFGLELQQWVMAEALGP